MKQLARGALAAQDAPLEDPTAEVSEGARNMIESFL